MKVAITRTIGSGLWQHREIGDLPVSGPNGHPPPLPRFPLPFSSTSHLTPDSRGGACVHQPSAHQSRDCDGHLQFICYIYQYFCIVYMIIYDICVQICIEWPCFPKVSLCPQNANPSPNIQCLMFRSSQCRSICQAAHGADAHNQDSVQWWYRL